MIRAVIGLGAIATACLLSTEASFAQSAPQDALPPDFHGRITYSGTFEAELTIPSRAVRHVNGRYSVEISYDGNSVTGRYSGTGGMVAGSFTGTRSGSRCRLTETRGDVIWDNVECSGSRYSADARGQGRISSVTHIDAQAERRPADDLAASTQASRGSLTSRARPQDAQQSDVPCNAGNGQHRRLYARDAIYRSEIDQLVARSDQTEENTLTHLAPLERWMSDHHRTTPLDAQISNIRINISGARAAGNLQEVLCLRRHAATLYSSKIESIENEDRAFREALQSGPRP